MDGCVYFVPFHPIPIVIYGLMESIAACNNSYTGMYFMARISICGKTFTD